VTTGIASCWPARLTCRQHIPHQYVPNTRSSRGGVYIDMFAHNKSGIAYLDRKRGSETVVDHKREPHQQPILLPSVPIEHQMYQVYQLSTRCRRGRPVTSSALLLAVRFKVVHRTHNARFMPCNGGCYLDVSVRACVRASDGVSHLLVCIH
jgi:hypothetical protein